MFEVGEEVVCVGVTELSGYVNEYITIGNHYIVDCSSDDVEDKSIFIRITTDQGSVLKYPVYLFQSVRKRRKETIDNILDLN